MNHPLRGSSAIVGVGLAGLGEAHGRSHLELLAQASIDALKEFGFVKGLFKSIKRILSCHPIKFLGGGEGFDPVKKEVKDNK